MAMADTISEPWLIALEYAYDSDIEILRQKERIAACYFLLLPIIFPIELRRGAP